MTELPLKAESSLRSSIHIFQSNFQVTAPRSAVVVTYEKSSFFIRLDLGDLGENIFNVRRSEEKSNLIGIAPALHQTARQTCGVWRAPSYMPHARSLSSAAQLT